MFCSATATWLPVGVTGAADSEHASSSYRMIINQTSSKLPAIEERPATAVIIHMTPRRSRHPCCWAFPFSSTARLPRTVSMRTLGGGIDGRVEIDGVGVFVCRNGLANPDVAHALQRIP